MKEKIYSKLDGTPSGKLLVKYYGMYHTFKEESFFVVVLLNYAMDIGGSFLGALK